MVKVFYGQKLNAVLGGKMFHEGVAEFEDDTEGIRFAGMFYRKYELVEVEAEAAAPKVAKKKTPVKKKGE